MHVCAHTCACICARAQVCTETDASKALPASAQPEQSPCWMKQRVGLSPLSSMQTPLRAPGQRPGWHSRTARCPPCSVGRAPSPCSWLRKPCRGNAPTNSWEMLIGRAGTFQGGGTGTITRGEREIGMSRCQRWRERKGRETRVKTRSAQ